MKAVLISDHKSVDATEGMLQMVIWSVPRSVPQTTHGFKYRLVYIRRGRRIVGVDNEFGKGDHMHLDGGGYPYHFSTLDQLIEDFLAEVEKRRMAL